MVRGVSQLAVYHPHLYGTHKPALPALPALPASSTKRRLDAVAVSGKGRVACTYRVDTAVRHVGSAVHNLPTTARPTWCPHAAAHGLQQCRQRSSWGRPAVGPLLCVATRGRVQGRGVVQRGGVRGGEGRAGGRAPSSRQVGAGVEAGNVGEAGEAGEAGVGAGLPSTGVVGFPLQPPDPPSQPPCHAAVHPAPLAAAACSGLRGRCTRAVVAQNRGVPRER